MHSDIVAYLGDISLFVDESIHSAIYYTYKIKASQMIHSQPHVRDVADLKSINDFNRCKKQLFFRTSVFLFNGL